jgi:hypothetical protein
MGVYHTLPFQRMGSSNLTPHFDEPQSFSPSSSRRGTPFSLPIVHSKHWEWDSIAAMATSTAERDHQYYRSTPRPGNSPPTTKAYESST